MRNKTQTTATGHSQYGCGSFCHEASDNRRGAANRPLSAHVQITCPKSTLSLISSSLSLVVPPAGTHETGERTGEHSIRVDPFVSLHEPRNEIRGSRMTILYGERRKTGLIVGRVKSVEVYYTGAARKHQLAGVPRVILLDNTKCKCVRLLSLLLLLSHTHKHSPVVQ